MSGKQGGSTSSMEYSPERIKRMNQAKARTERRWAAMAGPVEVRRVEPRSTGQPITPGEGSRA